MFLLLESPWLLLNEVLSTWLSLFDNFVVEFHSIYLFSMNNGPILAVLEPKKVQTVCLMIVLVLGLINDLDAVKIALQYQ